MRIDPTNRNTLWASIMVDELARNGITQAVISPGSRSTPLTVAFSRDERFTVHSILDERSAGFFALGVGMATGTPAVLVCTSGTAAANYYPAIVEANQSSVPLMALTADRPHDLRGSGANQTIDQVKLYGDHVRWFVDVAPPEANPPDRTLRYLRTTVCRAVAAAIKGPVHLNMPFRKPLEPTPVEGDVPPSVLAGLGARGRDRDAPFTVISRSQPAVQVERIATILTGAKSGVIIAGPMRETLGEVYALGEKLGFPVIAEPLSQLRVGAGALYAYDHYLPHMPDLMPEVIVRVGAMPVSGPLLRFINRNEDAQHIVFSHQWADGDHLANIHMPLEALPAIADTVTDAPVKWADRLWRAEGITRDVLEACPLTETSIVRDALAQVPAWGVVMVASSNPIRHLGEVMLPHKSAALYANRGASGIDGTVASALGAGCDVLIIGDLALYHDLNSLHLIRRLGRPLVIVCINNDGGGIFHRLPIAEHDPPFTELFATPHGLTFEHAAQMFDIPYERAEPGAAFREAYQAAMASGDAHLIEVPTDAAEFERQRRALMAEVQERLKEAGLV